MPIGDEKARVAQLAQLLAGSPSSWEVTDAVLAVAAVRASDGDDAAVVDVTGGASIVVASDYVRGVKFALYELGLLSYYDLGWYLAAANLSDIAAMGAVPVGLLTVVRYDATMNDEAYLDVMRGAKDAAASVGATILGGDSGGAERLILSASAIGLAGLGQSLTRAAAEAGDVVCLTGSVGAPAAAIVHLTNPDSAPASDSAVDGLLAAWRRPEPRVAQGLILAREGGRVACQDVSDGLRSTLSELAAASNVSFVVNADDIPLDAAVTEVATIHGLDPIALATSASVDFELLFTVAPERFETVQRAFTDAGHALHVIGEAVDGNGIKLRASDGELSDFAGVEWRHQSEDIAGLLTERSRTQPST